MTDRRTFLKHSAVLGAVGLLDPGHALGAPWIGGPRRGAPDLVLRGAFILDGSGRPGFEADVAVTGGRITAVGRVGERGADEIDLRGLALAPGFVDIHSHADTELLVEPRAESVVRQGITTVVVGQDGNSILTSEAEARGRGVPYHDLATFFAALERTPPAVHLASMVGHGSVRGYVMGGATRAPTAAELDRMRAEVRRALRQGAVGLSSGLEYTPGSFADTDELIALAGELVGTGYPYASHMRNEDDRLLTAVEEALRVGREAGVPVQISHLKAQGRRNGWKAGLALALVDSAAGQGVDVHIDRYPYVAYATGLTSLFPPEARAAGIPALVERLRGGEGGAIEAAVRAKVALLGDWDAVRISSAGASTAWARGRRLGELAAERGVDPFDLTVALLEANGGSVGMIGFGMSEENTARILAHARTMPASDGGAYAPYGPLSGGSPHPRGYGTFPRYLGHYVRDLGILPLEEAVRRASALPAEKLGLADRGRIEPGRIADLVAFDPETISDGATFDTPHRYPTGIPHVVVGGRPTIREGEQTGAFAGGPIRGRGAV